MPSITLTEEESNLRLLLLDVAKSISPSQKHDPHIEGPVVIRWAGGWVRDKLLGLQSHDIDVAINNMTGKAFAERVHQLFEGEPPSQVHGFKRSDISKVHNVDANPEKSKHLATAILRIRNLDLDFVNLRKEVYTDDSRAPEKLEFGTAEEDAARRDATINALFYNLNTDQIEDFTGGVPDLEARIIRTPMEPLKTFTDDPLRVLRLIRFASRLDFSIHPGTERYMADEKVLASLRIKISRERVGIELEKMLRDRHSRTALQLIERLRLYLAIFSDPSREVPDLPLLPRWSIACDCLQELSDNKTPNSIFDLLVRTEDDRYVAWNLAAVSPWMRIETLPGPPLPKNQPTSALVAREAYKAPNWLSKAISACQDNLGVILDLKRAVLAEDPETRQRDVLGMKIRRVDARGHWKLQILNALLIEAMEELPDWQRSEKRSEDASQRQTAFLHGWQKFLDHLLEMDVWSAPSLKGLMTGKELATALGTKPGRWTGPALDMCMEWLLRNPGAEDPAGAVEDVRRRADELVPLGLNLS